MKLIFELGRAERALSLLPSCDVPEKTPERGFLRAAPPELPELSETEISRHYARLAKRVHGVCDGFYPLGSCTMKYNPRINEELASLPGFTDIHPLQPPATVSGCLEVIKALEDSLCALSGMDAFTISPAAGAHGEFTGLLLIKAYHRSRNDFTRTKMLVPDSAHGTNPASASMAGFSTVHIPSTQDGFVDLEALNAAVGPDTAGLMLTNPNTLGLFEHDILEITRIVHDAGGLIYYDGANMNAVMGVVRPGDMGFDVMHLNLHKTFSAPHGGGGPGSGPVGCKSFLAEFLPDSEFFETPDKSIGAVKSFHGNFLVAVRALAYILTLGGDGLFEASQTAVLNANYLMKRLSEKYDIVSTGFCMHEFVMTLQELKHKTGVSALDIAKSLLDHGIHPPTIYFPLIVHEAMMLEPTETESKEALDEAADVFLALYELACTSPDLLHSAPVKTPVRRLDEAGAARSPRLRYSPLP